MAFRSGARSDKRAARHDHRGVPRCGLIRWPLRDAPVAVGVDVSTATPVCARACRIRASSTGDSPPARRTPSPTRRSCWAVCTTSTCAGCSGRCAGSPADGHFRELFARLIPGACAPPDRGVPTLDAERLEASDVPRLSKLASV
jgi:hypothetical protein